MICAVPECKRIATKTPTLRGTAYPQLSLCENHFVTCITYAEIENWFLKLKLLLDREICTWNATTNGEKVDVAKLTNTLK